MSYTKTKRVSRRAVASSPAILNATDTKPTIWEALNEPVLEVSEGFARGIVGVAVLLLVFAWVMPYWSMAPADLPVISYNSPIIQPASAPRVGATAGKVAGAQITAAPVWYEVVAGLPQDFANSFAVAATQVLDISEPMRTYSSFFGPGAHAVWSAWLDLMKDPGT